jgi:hypothetical protein
MHAVGSRQAQRKHARPDARGVPSLCLSPPSPLPNRYQPCRCGRCARTFASAPNYLDLTLTSGVPQTVYQQKAWQGTELFRQPLVSFIYERGWRQK